MSIVSHLHQLFNAETCQSYIHALRWKDRPLPCPGLLWDSGVVDKTMSYNPICASYILLEALIFQEPYKCVACFRRSCEYKTLKPNKSHSDMSTSSFRSFV
jgi:hypothetical protein